MNKIILTSAAAIFVLAAACGQKSSSQTDSSSTDTENFAVDKKQGQVSIRTSKLSTNDIPGEIAYQGDLVVAYKYTDKTGENIVMLTETDVMEWETDDGHFLSNKSVYAHRFLKKGNNWEEIWRVYDTEFECTNYPIAEFVRGAFSITDLNSDGVAEIWLMYIKSCKGDVSPDNMFLRMYDNKEVYTVQGETKIETSDGINKYVEGGRYELDSKFLNRNTPAVFVDYAKKLWEKHIKANVKN